MFLIIGVVFLRLRTLERNHPSRAGQDRRRTWRRVCFDTTLLHLTLEPPPPGSYLAAVTDFTEMVSPLAVPVTLASSQASLLSLSSAA